MVISYPKYVRMFVCTYFLCSILICAMGRFVDLYTAKLQVVQLTPHAHSCTWTHRQIHTRMHTQTHIHTHIHTHTHTHTHMHTQSNKHMFVHTVYKGLYASHILSNLLTRQILPTLWGEPETS